MEPLPRETLTVDLGPRSYPILIGHEWLEELGPTLRRQTPLERVLVVSDGRVNGLYGEAVAASLARAGFLAETLVVPEGEMFKTLDTCLSVYSFLLANNFSRETVLLALGGGVVGDLTGFCAATYMRGVPYVQVPTTLLAMVDSSVGGKTGVNHPLGKNMIGAFHQPLLVFIDIHCLDSLAPVEFRAGFAEVVKYGVIRDAALFAYCEQENSSVFSLDARALQHVVKTSCAIKAEVVALDEREAGLRAILNFGHTVGHVVESLTNYTFYKHGEAVAIGMAAAGRLAVKLGKFAAAEQQRLEALLEHSGLPARIPKRLETDDLVERMRKDKKVSHGKTRFVLPEAIGRVGIVGDVSPLVLREVLEGMRA